MGVTYDNLLDELLMHTHSDEDLSSFTVLDARYVSVSGDTMAGNLNMGTYNLIGGTGITDILKLQSTTGNGTLTSPAIQLLTGNNGATTAVTVLNNGNVGIGTTAPQGLFDVTGSGGSSIQLLRVPSGWNAAISMFDHSANPWSLGIYNADDSFRIADSSAVGSSDRLTISSTGNVGIGTTAPGEKFVVKGTTSNGIIVDGGRFFQPGTGSGTGIRFGLGYSDADNQVAGIQGYYDGTGPAFGIFTGASNTQQLTVLSGGNVGIGTTSPSTLLSLGSTGYTFASSGLSFGDMDTGLYESADDKLNIRTAGSDWMTILSDGKVGIGTTGPGTRLEVVENTTNYAVSITNSHASGYGLTLTGASGNNPTLRLRDNNGAERLRVTGSGNVGIGTTAPAGKLHIKGTADDQQLIVQGNATQTSNLQEWQNSSGTVLSAFSGLGYLGIGVTPTSPLTITKTFTDAASSSVGSVYSVATFTNTASTGNVYYANARYMQTPATAYNHGATYADYNENQFNGLTGGSYGIQYGQFAKVKTMATSTANVAVAIAVASMADHAGTGVLSSAIAQNNTVILRDGAGSITAAYGLYTSIQNASTGASTIGTGMGINITAPTATGSITNMYGAYIANQGAAKVTNAYGLYIDSQSGAGTTNVAILTNAGNIVFNEGGDASTDFRVESDTEANMLYLDANGDTDGALYLGGTTNGIKVNKGGVLTFLGTANISGGATGTFTTADAKTVTVIGGIITSIV